MPSVAVTGSSAVTEQPAAPVVVTKPGEYRLRITTQRYDGVADCGYPTCSRLTAPDLDVKTDDRVFTVTPAPK